MNKRCQCLGNTLQLSWLLVADIRNGVWPHVKKMNLEAYEAAHRMRNLGNQVLKSYWN